MLFELEEIALFDYTIQLIPDNQVNELALNLKKEAKNICDKGYTSIVTQPHISLLNFSKLEKMKHLSGPSVRSFQLTKGNY